MNIKRKSNKIKKNNKSKNNKSKKKLHKGKLLYFSMNGCPYCDNFNPLWDKITKKNPSIIKLKIDRENNHKLIDKFKIKTFPTLLILKGKKIINFKYNRTEYMIKKFLKENKLI